jgi:hypothetical protein
MHRVHLALLLLVLALPGVALAVPACVYDQAGTLKHIATTESDCFATYGGTYLSGGLGDLAANPNQLGGTPLPALGTEDSAWLIGQIVLLFVLAVVGNRTLRVLGWR